MCVYIHIYTYVYIYIYIYIYIYLCVLYIIYINIRKIRTYFLKITDIPHLSDVALQIY